jgi:hypothetical protein
MRAFLATAWQNSETLSYLDEGKSAWVSQWLVRSAKELAAGLRVDGAAPVDTKCAFDTVTTLLRALAATRGCSVVDEAAWRDLEGLVARARERNHPEPPSSPEAAIVRAADVFVGDSTSEAEMAASKAGGVASELTADSGSGANPVRRDTRGVSGEVQQGHEASLQVSSTPAPEASLAEEDDDDVVADREGGLPAEAAGSRGQAMLDVLRRNGQLGRVEAPLPLSDAQTGLL